MAYGLPNRTSQHDLLNSCCVRHRHLRGNHRIVPFSFSRTKGALRNPKKYQAQGGETSSGDPSSMIIRKIAKSRLYLWEACLTFSKANLQLSWNVWNWLMRFIGERRRIIGRNYSKGAASFQGFHGWEVNRRCKMMQTWANQVFWKNQQWS